MKRLINSPWSMWFMAVSFVLFQFLLQLSVGVMVKPLMESFHLTALGVGVLIGSFYVIYVLLQTPAGMLVDRYGPRRLLGGGGVVCALGCVLFAISSHVELAFFGRLLMGVGASFAFVSILYVIEHWFPAKRFALMVGLVETVGMLGVLLGNVYSAYLLEHMDWRSLMYVAAVIAFFLGLANYSVVRDGRDHVETTELPASREEFFKDVRWVIRQPLLWWNGIYSGLMFSGVTVFAALWVLPYLQLRQSAPTILITLESSLVFVGLAVGAPLMGFLYPRLKQPGKFLFCTALSAALICCWLIQKPPASIWLGSIIFFILGIFLSSYVLNFTQANYWVPRHVRSTCIGFTNALCVVTAPLLQPLVGAILHYLAAAHGGGETYTIGEYRWALSVIPIGLLIAAGMAWLLTAKHLKTKKCTDIVG